MPSIFALDLTKQIYNICAFSNKHTYTHVFSRKETRKKELGLNIQMFINNSGLKAIILCVCVVPHKMFVFALIYFKKENFIWGRRQLIGKWIRRVLRRRKNLCMNISNIYCFQCLSWGGSNAFSICRNLWSELYWRKSMLSQLFKNRRTEFSQITPCDCL